MGPRAPGAAPLPAPRAEAPSNTMSCSMPPPTPLHDGLVQPGYPGVTDPSPLCFTRIPHFFHFFCSVGEFFEFFRET